MVSLRLKDIADVKNLRNAVRFVKQDKSAERIHCPLYDLPYLWKIEEKLLDRLVNHRMRGLDKITLNCLLSIWILEVETITESVHQSYFFDT